MKEIVMLTKTGRIPVRVEIARSSAELMKGLKYRSKLNYNEGMLFEFPKEGFHAMHMENTSIPLDMVFISSDLEVVDIKKGIPRSPMLVKPERLCKFVLEVNRDFCRHKNVQIGDKLKKWL